MNAVLSAPTRVCASCCRPRPAASFPLMRSGRPRRTCSTCLSKETGPALPLCPAPTETDLALERRIDGIAEDLQLTARQPATLARRYKIERLRAALVSAVRLRSAAQILRLAVEMSGRDGQHH